MFSEHWHSEQHSILACLSEFLELQAPVIMSNDPSPSKESQPSPLQNPLLLVSSLFKVSP